MDLRWIEQQPLSGNSKSNQTQQTSSKRSKTDHPLSGKRKANNENQPPQKRRNLNAFSPIKPHIFKTPSPQKTMPPLQASPEDIRGIYDKPPSPVRTPPEKFPLIASTPIANQQTLQLVAVKNNCIEAQPNVQELVVVREPKLH